MVDLGKDLCQKEFIIVSDDSCHEYIIPLKSTSTGIQCGGEVKIMKMV